MDYNYDELYNDKELFGEQYIGLLEYFKNIKKNIILYN